MAVYVNAVKNAIANVFSCLKVRTAIISMEDDYNRMNIAPRCMAMDRNSIVSCAPFGLTGTKSNSFASHSPGYIFEFVVAPLGDNAHQILGEDTVFRIVCLIDQGV